jgi:protein phosphatase 1L
VLEAADRIDEVAERGEGFAAYCRKGKGRKRVEMEDRHVAAVALGGDRGQAMFGVFDGHGGKSAAEFAAENMPRIVAEELERGGGAEEAVRRAYLRTDEEFSSSTADAEGSAGGACCVTALLREEDSGRRRQLVVSGAGDCRAVLSRGGRAEALTDDHRASRRDERDRIEALRGGLVLNCRGVWRVQGSLAVTRGIGDAHLKPWVVAEPETATVDVDERCELLILASDGLWDKVGNQEAVDAARVAAACPGGLPAACRRLVEMAAARGSTDDISVLVIQLQRHLR